MNTPRASSEDLASTPAMRSVLVTDERFALVQLTLPPYHAGTAPHLHPSFTEGCYVLEGTLAVTIGEQTITLTPGTAARIPAGVLHSVWNPTAMPILMLLIYSPGPSAALADALASGAAGDPLPAVGIGG